ncbi:tRNA lysidine(34) synthetase TilS [Luteibaculum oceani]|uniref:tRNA(Ile)-lysidine synthase n=1 Tax=Luteibaculum oceani TaxID=1294296 RepID=A0A5C6V8N9_9FLAO|nr:tRNA lysidine(34) synthetase TilS [Luteibaculum oceani]TXC81772.1 tRNA lysidine(34) synthetase TilS [Luteibaculum oceani]
MDNWLQRVKSRIEYNVAETDKLLLALSGGADSIALFHVLRQFGVQFSVAHINYNLRGEDAKMDADFAERLAHQHQIEFFKKEVFPGEESKNDLQSWARNIRYQFFDQLIREQDFTLLALGHHKNDQIEQFFLKSMRPSSVFSLGGMKILDGNRFRPLLDVNKDDIKSWLLANKWEWREDKTNKKTDYKRNWWRLKGIPHIQTQYPDLEQRLSTLQEKMQQVEQAMTFALRALITPFITQLFREVTQFDLKAFKREHNSKELFSYWLQEKGFSVDTIERLWGFDSEDFESKMFKGSQDLDAEFKGGVLYLFKPSNTSGPNYNVQSIEDLQKLDRIKAVSLVKEEADAKLEGHKSFILPIKEHAFPISIQPTDEGDKIAVFGLGGKKKTAKELFKDARMPQCIRKYFYTWKNKSGVLFIENLRTSELTRWSGGQVQHYKIELN